MFRILPSLAGQLIFAYSENSGDNFEKILNNLSGLDDNSMFDYVQNVKDEVKDNKGRLITVKSGFGALSAKGFGQRETYRIL